MSGFHTPGPWLPRRVDSQCWEIDAPNGDPRIGHTTWTGLAVVYGSDDVGRTAAPVCEANARLIAAAPNLLAALQLLTTKSEKQATGAGWNKRLAAARKAVAEALGEQP
jgi:hypothetical protein